MRSERSVLSLVPMIKLSTVLGLTPYYSFKTNTLVFNKTFKCYSLLLATLLTAFSIYCLIGQMRELYQNKITFLSLVAITSEIFGLATFLVTTLGATFWNRNCWRKLIFQLRSLENDSKTTIPSKRFNFRNGNMALGAGFFYYIIFSIYQYYFWRLDVFLLSWVIWFTTGFVISNLAFNIVFLIKYRYEDRMSELYLGPHFSSSVIKRIQQHCFMLNEIVENFNKTFGWPILGMLARLVSQMLSCCMSIIFDIPNKEITITFCLLYGALIVFGPVTLLFSCDLVVTGSRKVLTQCYKLHRWIPLDSKQCKELSRLESLLENNPPVFTAAGFFSVNKSTLPGLFSTFTTYLIVAIQFKDKI